MQVRVRPSEFPEHIVSSISWDVLGVRTQVDKQRRIVVTSIRPGGVAEAAGVQVKDVILRIDNRPVQSARQYRDALMSANKRATAVLLIQRGKQKYYATLNW